MIDLDDVADRVDRQVGELRDRERCGQVRDDVERRVVARRAGQVAATGVVTRARH
jgi:hypothetical protein